MLWHGNSTYLSEVTNVFGNVIRSSLRLLLTYSDDFDICFCTFSVFVFFFQVNILVLLSLGVLGRFLN